MNSFTSRLTGFLLILLTVFGACNKDATLTNNSVFLVAEPASTSNGGVIKAQVPGGKYIKDAYVVVLRDEVVDVEDEVAQIIKGMGGAKADRLYKHAIKGFSIKIPAAAIQGLSKHPKVKYIEQDQVVTVDATQTGATWGLDRVDQQNLPLSGTYTYTKTGSTVNAYIFDTGIRYDHQEFGGRAKLGFDAFNQGGNDGNGHGTHVAGTVGGAVYGIAKSVQLFAVRVMDNDGYGPTSGVIAGVDWAVGHHTPGTPAVGNMSLGGGASTALDDAVKRAVTDGIVMCVAAGNDNALASNYSPARTAEAITVGATQSNDARASYSNYGSILDIFAPGSSITSAWSTSSTALNTISGTSMASPHVAGVVALYLDANPTATPEQVESALKSAATLNKVTSAGNGSPNLLLYIGTIGDGGTTTPSAPAAPTLLSPSIGATGRPVTNSAVSWSAVASVTGYTVELSTTQEFSAPFATRTVSSGTTSASFSGLSALTMYYWRVGATNASGTTWSATWSFTTVLGIPALSSPANNATNVSRTPTLVWTSTGAASYDVQVASSSNFSSTSLVVNNITSTNSVSGTSYTLPILLNLRTTYYWRVRSRGSNGTLVSSWSSSRRFTTIK